MPIARERPAQLAVPTTEDPEEPINLMVTGLVIADAIVDMNQLSPPKPLPQSNTLNHAARQPALPPSFA
jgi:hypothetical protein